jgi:hypothetical protein
MTLTYPEASRFCDQRGDNHVLFISRCLRRVAIGIRRSKGGADGEFALACRSRGLSAAMLSPQTEQVTQTMGSLLPRKCSIWFRAIEPSFRSTTKRLGRQASSLSRRSLGSEPTRARLRQSNFPDLLLVGFLLSEIGEFLGV